MFKCICTIGADWYGHFMAFSVCLWIETCLFWIADSFSRSSHFQNQPLPGLPRFIHEHSGLTDSSAITYSRIQLSIHLSILLDCGLPVYLSVHVHAECCSLANCFPLGPARAEEAPFGVANRLGSNMSVKKWKKTASHNIHGWFAIHAIKIII